MLRQELKRDFKDMTRCKEFYFSLLISFALVFGVLFFCLFSFYKTDVTYLNPAYVYWGPGGTGFNWDARYTANTFPNSIMNPVFVRTAMPFLAALAYAYHSFDDRRSGVANVVIPRVGKRNYYLGNLLTSFLGAFFIVLIPLVLEQVVLLICCPTGTQNIVAYEPLKDNYSQMFCNKIGGSFTAFQLNHPYLNNFLYCLIPALTSGLFGAVAFSLSLFLRKSRFLVLTLPGIVWLVVGFLIAKFNFTMEPGYALFASGNIMLFPIVALVLAGICALFVVLYRRFQKDESL